MVNKPNKKSNYKNFKKGKLGNLAFKSSYLVFGTVGLKATESGILTFKQLESARQAITRKIKRKGKIWMRVSPDISITAKSTGTRMGKGKGQISHWGAKVKKGTVLLEICGLKLEILKIALKNGSVKLPIKTKVFD